jgi:hypothetical protein
VVKHCRLLICSCVHIAVGPCAKGHFIHARPTLDPEFFFFVCSCVSLKVYSHLLLGMVSEIV